MFLRSALVAAAVSAIAAITAPVSAEEAAAPAPCEASSFRIYFAPDSAEVNAVAQETIAYAARAAARCDYSELRVSVDATSPLATARAEAIRTATANRGWDAVRVEARTGATGFTNVSHGPDYAEVMVSPTASPAATTTDVGV